VNNERWFDAQNLNALDNCNLYDQMVV